jgi:hypothetical protein
VRTVVTLLVLMLWHPALFGESAKRDRVSVLTLEGKAVDPIRAAKPSSRFLAFVFVRTDCPIANSYAPELRRLHTEFTARGVEFWLVYGDDESPAAIRDHLRDYSYPFGALRDPRHAFATRSRVRVTPEVAIYRSSGELLYHGRIDDRYVDLGKARPAPTTRDFQAALASVTTGKPAKSPDGPAVGCFIEEVR